MRLWVIERERTYRADGEDEREDEEGVLATDVCGDGSAAECTEECTCLEDGDDVGGDGVLLGDVACEAEVLCKVVLCDDASADSSVVSEEDDAPVRDEREPCVGYVVVNRQYGEVSRWRTHSIL